MWLATLTLVLVLEPSRRSPETERPTAARWRVRPEPCLLVAIFILLLVPIVATAQTAIDLGDLNISPARVPQWHPPTDAETNYLSAQNWMQYDATCECASDPCTVDGGGGDGCAPASGTAAFPNSWGCSPANAADESGSATSDFSDINCQIAAANDKSVIYLPNGSYDMGDATGEVIRIPRSNIVLRCESNTATTLEMTTAGIRGATSCANGTLTSNEACSAHIVSIGKDAVRPATAWTSGYTYHETEVGVADSSGFSVGQWAFLNIADTGWTANRSQVTKCPTYLDIPGAQKATDLSLYALEKIATIDGNTITLERGHRMDFTLDGATCSDEGVASPFDSPLEHVGLENCRLTSDSSVAQIDIDAGGASPFVAMSGVIESWVVDNVVERAEREVLRLTFAARNWIQGNTFRNWGYLDSTFSTSAVRINKVTTDNVFENNYLVDFVVGIYTHQGARGNVWAYNYLRQGSPPNSHERGFFSHGLYDGENLVEGNDSDTNTSWDIWWGSHGPRLGYYRNRTVASPTQRDSSFGGNIDGQSRWAQSSNDIFAGDEFFVIGNTAEFFYSNWLGNSNDDALTGDHDLDSWTTNLWVEKNVFRNTNTCTGDPSSSRCGFHQDTPEATTSCGTVSGDCITGTGPNGVLGNNYGGDSPSADHVNDSDIPHSLYRSSKTAPIWWCEEACNWDDVHDGIGAWGDDFGGALCKLPAQILAEGGECTLLFRPPSPPILLN